MSVSKKAFIKELIREIPPGEKFTASDIMDRALKTTKGRKLFIVGYSVAHTIGTMDDVITVDRVNSTNVYERVEA